MSKELNLLIKFPSRERPGQFFQVLNKAQKMRSSKTTQFLITLDANDSSMHNDRVRATLNMWGNLRYIYGISQGKVHAVNRDMDQAGDWDVLLLLSDDMAPVMQGYDQIICDRMQEHFPDLDGVLHFNDGFRGSDLNTLIIVGRKYYDRFGYLYNPLYKSLWCDNEFTEVSKALGKVKYFEQVIIQHRHPMNVRNLAIDNLYRRNDRHFTEDKNTYFERKEKNFDLPIIETNG